MRLIGSLIGVALVLALLASAPATRPTRIPANLGPDLDRIVAEYDTIIVGTVTSVGMRGDAESPLARALLGWGVTVKVDQVLQGDRPPRDAVAIYIHSPAITFGGYKALDDLVGRPCAWAIKREGEAIRKTEAPFLGQHFTTADIELLKARIRAHQASSRPATRPASQPAGKQSER